MISIGVFQIQIRIFSLKYWACRKYISKLTKSSKCQQNEEKKGDRILTLDFFLNQWPD